MTDTTTSTPSTASPEIDALQAALAGEHAAMYAIGVAGGHLRRAQFVAASELLGRHRDRRDRLTELLLAADAEPVAAAPAYDLPSTVRTAADAAALIRVVEQRLAVVYGDLVEVADTAAIRTLAIQAVIAAASEVIQWGGAPTAFPGTA